MAAWDRDKGSQARSGKAQRAFVESALHDWR